MKTYLLIMLALQASALCSNNDKEPSARSKAIARVVLMILFVWGLWLVLPLIGGPES